MFRSLPQVEKRLVALSHSPEPVATFAIAAGGVAAAGCCCELGAIVPPLELAFAPPLLVASEGPVAACSLGHRFPAAELERRLPADVQALVPRNSNHTVIPCCESR
jgi:hypothetical protein